MGKPSLTYTQHQGVADGRYAVPDGVFPRLPTGPVLNSVPAHSSGITEIEVGTHSG